MLVQSFKPFAHVLSSEFRGQLCDQCFRHYENLKKCSACKVPRYCSTQCQRQDWKIHKKECPHFKRCSPEIPTTSARLMYRLILRKQWGDDQKISDTFCGKSRTFQDLMTHLQEINEDERRMTQFIEMMATVRTFCDGELNDVSASECLEIFGKMVINSFSICDGEMRPVGVGIYLGPSVLNHSCSPNAVAVFNGIDLVIRPLKDTAPDEELTISYIDQMAALNNRLSDLQEQYYFTCMCSLCLDEKTNYEMESGTCPVKGCRGLVSIKNGSSLCSICQHEVSSEVMQQLQGGIKKIDDKLAEVKILEQNNEWSKILDICEECLKYSEVIEMSPVNVSKFKVLDKAFDACVFLQDWDKAVQFARLTLPAYRKHLCDRHPRTGVQIMKMGKILLYQQKLSDALQALQQAFNILLVSHGSEHPLVATLKGLIDQCMEEMRVQLQNNE